MHAILWCAALAAVLAAAAVLVYRASLTRSTVILAELAFAIVLGAGCRLLLVRTTPRRVPVLNYHSVSVSPGWLPNADAVSISPSQFERQLSYLKRNGYVTLTIGEVHDVLLGGTAPETGARCVALTFDDGYADNWIAAYPLLKKYGMKATFFVSTDFITDGGTRPTLEDVWGGGVPGEDALDWDGYLTWDELREMERGGHGEVESHDRQHTRLFESGTAIGVNSPEDTNLWMFWNERRDLKPAWWKAGESDLAPLWGTPVYPQAPALAGPAFLPDGSGGGRRETDEEYAGRVEENLAGCKRIMEKEMNKTVRFLAWPENEFSDKAEETAHRLGYSATVSDYHDTRNVPRERPDRVTRVTIRKNAAGLECAACDFISFVCALKTFEGRYHYYPFTVLISTARKILSAVRGG